jgi:hypothetical protein
MISKGFLRLLIPGNESGEGEWGRGVGKGKGRGGLPVYCVMLINKYHYWHGLGHSRAYSRQQEDDPDAPFRYGKNRS